MRAPMTMLYQIPPLYKSFTENLKVVLFGLFFIVAPVIAWVSFASIISGPESLMILVVVNVFFSLFLMVYLVFFYYPILLRTYGTQTFYSTPFELIRVNKLFGIPIKKSWRRERIKTIRKDIQIMEQHSTQGSETRISVITRLLIEDIDGKTSELLKAEDYVLNELMNELKYDGFPTKGLLSQALEGAKNFLKRILDEGRQEDLT